ncbi:MtrAB system histidine kinase MtrB [Trueperella bialowiezensis]|uniref:Sensor histidine kinase MtrB n=1 Tax=Trueperella bialowiezensis TaxID=312285 RepID=A0A448PD88_9ACTO|nr:MtrAB system histidine kinase MtrB [Trueperella bialowiezensis]VEI12890.1 Signal transduction histidine-protein kinase ArlS [Trueperella bialowiezensis]
MNLPAPAGGRFRSLTRRIGGLRERWYSSLSLRVIVSIVAAGVMGIVIMGFAITAQVRASVFDAAVDADVEQFSTDVQLAQDRFGASAPSAGRTQEVANTLVASMYDPTRGVLGAVLLRAPDQPAMATQIFEPATASATRVRSLITPELRELVLESSEIGWQSVGIPDGDSIQPGIIIGTTIDIPGAGLYEIYAAYSMANQEELISSTTRVMWISVAVLLFLLGVVTWAVMRWVLSPVREASENARQLADGEFHTRMEVKGSDEIAQLAESFNQMAESLETQFTQMERLSKVQTEFVSAVSHELRSPVTTVRMAGQLIYDKREELPANLKRAVELQYSQLLNLDATLADLLEISRYDAGGMTLATESADVGDLVAEVIEAAEPLAQSNSVQVSFTIHGDTQAEVEPRRIRRLVRNLLVNALEHAEEKPVDVVVQANDTAVAVMVQDHGIGISSDQIEHVFERFWRADASRVRKSGGTGLGLTIAREDAQIHGGTLEVAGELGVGATFLLTLPKVPHSSFVPPIPLTPPAACEPLAEDEPAPESEPVPEEDQVSGGAL